MCLFVQSVWRQRTASEEDDVLLVEVLCGHLVGRGHTVAVAKPVHAQRSLSLGVWRLGLELK